MAKMPNSRCESLYFLRSVNCMQLCCCLIYKFIDIYIDGHDGHDTFAILWVQLGIMPLRAVNG